MPRNGWNLSKSNARQYRNRLPHDCLNCTTLSHAGPDIETHTCEKVVDVNSCVSLLNPTSPWGLAVFLYRGQEACLGL